MVQIAVCCVLYWARSAKCVSERSDGKGQIERGTTVALH